MSVGPLQRKPKNPLAFQNVGPTNNQNGNANYNNVGINGEGNNNKAPNSREDILPPQPPKAQGKNQSE